MSPYSGTGDAWVPFAAKPHAMQAEETASPTGTALSTVHLPFTDDTVRRRTTPMSKDSVRRSPKPACRTPQEKGRPSRPDGRCQGECRPRPVHAHRGGPAPRPKHSEDRKTRHLSPPPDVRHQRFPPRRNLFLRDHTKARERHPEEQTPKRKSISLTTDAAILTIPWVAGNTAVRRPSLRTPSNSGIS